ncbi:MAG: signal peptidase I [Verrucomicrobia bacterium]|nr:signal peptidase I [Verrucomicrobiota bacterium]MDA1086253.1 signal peptidase I [Verrucomicrobiota bacterium]
MFSKKRQTRKAARDLCRHATHLLNMRGDIMPQRESDELAGHHDRLLAAVQANDEAAMNEAGEELGHLLERLAPRPARAALRENLEVLVVAIAVAMAFRAYFLQPFKIPTGSMQPTLNGIRYTAASKGDGDVNWTHRLPASLLRQLIVGERYMEVHAKRSGPVSILQHGNSSTAYIRISGVPHKIDLAMSHFVRNGEHVRKGQLLASGIRHAGDHLFVNKVSWNFRRPRRSEVMVFTTDDIEALKEKKTHYIKRMVGLPGERVSIDPPYLVIDGKRVTESKGVARVQSCEDGYTGYEFAPANGYALGGPADFVQLTAEQYFACGDNQRNSLDGRFWGSVPSANLVGPAVCVYWPITDHFGLIE